MFGPLGCCGDGRVLPANLLIFLITLQQMLIKIIVYLVLLTTLKVQAIETNIEIEEIEIEEIQIQGNINEHIEVKFPFDQVVEVRIKNESMPGYVRMIENRFQLMTQKATDILSSDKLTTLQQLRTPFSSSGVRLFDFKKSLIVYESPDKFKVVVENFMNQFKIWSQYQFKQMRGRNAEITVVEDNFVMVILSETQLILFNETDQFIQENPFNTTKRITLKKIISNDDMLFLTILNNTAYFCTIQDGNLTIRNSQPLTKKENILKVATFQRGKLFKGGQQIWLLDEDQGLFLIVVNDKLKLASHPVRVQNIAGCYELDIKIEEHNIWALLTCMEGDSSTFKEYYYDNDSPTYPFILKKVQPFLERCFADKFIFFQDYIFSAEDNSLDIFVPSSESKDKVVYDKYWVPLGMNSFVIEQDTKKQRLFVKGVNDGILYKKQLILENYTLLLMTPEVVNENVLLEVDYLCTKGLNGPKHICSSDVILNLNIHNNLVSYIRWKSFNIGLALLLSTTLAAVFLLCRYKYRSIYHRAYKKLKELTNPDKCQI